jgi:hypothetical protein
MLGDPSGAAALVQAVADQAWDTGWSLTGMGQFGPSLSPLDSRIIALGNTRDPRAIEVILAKLAALDATSAFSHHRALALAFETLRDPKAAAPLAALLHKPGMTGFACEDIATAKRTAETADPNVDRDRSLRELILARALYRCGDHEGLGKRILEAYSRDLRAYFARHAYLVLHAK